MTKIVLATGNAGKVRELAALLAPLNLDVSAQSDFDVPEAEETGTTFVENAIIKARNAARVTGLPAIADDSGLVVDALGGAPGIYSSRFAGVDASDADNIDKLLAELADVPEAARSARFVCTLVYLRHADDPTPIICQGSWEGHITRERSGREGFGYDPVFFAPEVNKTAAELSKDEKNQLSHRGKALSMLVGELKA
ncbi:XTP/dITP diphosphatase [Gallaecimonas sp. GXIMD4217]|uniref:XTP/dITP diphosphatase n=1 Tax=Gallaecimonas sp. GXIMD4217 TaxID=3131927 RepID=UPI00311B2FAE